MTLRPVFMNTDRCTPERPCPVLNRLHLLMWGECFVLETDDDKGDEE